MTMADIVVGDDHAAFAEALAAVLDTAGHHVVAVETTMDGLATAVRDTSPDLCLVDRWFDDGDALELLAELRDSSPATQILVITADPDTSVAQRALDRGADGFVHKTRGISALLAAIERALAGATVVELAPRRSVPHPAKPDQAQQLASHLTEREQQCLALLVEGASTPEMATRLGVTVTTVRAHVHAAMTKLGTHTRLKASAYAVRHGLVPPTPTAGEAV
jgi:two-component system, NarL family, nitrate/nitrite response regulator NarL